MRRLRNKRIRHAQVLRFNQLQNELQKRGSSISENVLTNGRTVIGAHVTVGSGDFRDASVGDFTYARHNVQLNGAKIGRFCSIASNVSLILSTHPTSFVSTYPGFYGAPESFIFPFGKVEFDNAPKNADGVSLTIGNDVWIGTDVLIMPGLVIGDGAIIGAKALVTKDVPPYAIVGGVPAKIIRFRFSPENVTFLLEQKWWNWPIEKIGRFAPLFSDVELLKKAILNESDLRNCDMS